MDGHTSAAGCPVPAPGCKWRRLRSNSPLRTPPMKASHSAAVKRRTPPHGFLLSRTRIISSARPTSTQWPLFMLRELFRQERPILTGGQSRGPLPAAPLIARQGATRLSLEAGDRGDKPGNRLNGADQKPCELLRVVPGQTSARLRHCGLLLACPAAGWFPPGTGPARSGTCSDRSGSSEPLDSMLSYRQARSYRPRAKSSRRAE